MKKTVIVLMVITIVSKVLGFLRDLFLSYFYGASYISDAYLISLTIPTVIFAIIAKAITTGYIPMYTRIEEEEGTKRANTYTNNVLNVLLILCTCIVGVGLLKTEWMVKLFASGFQGTTLQLAIFYTRISLAGVYFTAMYYILAGYLEIKGKFVVPALTGLPANIILICSIFISSYTNHYILAIGSVAAIFAQFFILIIYSYKNEYRYTPFLYMRDPHIKKMVVLSLPAILGTSVSQINTLIDRTLASRLSEGGIAALNYASTLSSFIQGILVGALTTVLFPKISRLAVEDQRDEIKKFLSSAINTVNILILPATVGFMIFSEPIVVFLFGRGQFDLAAIHMTSTALFFYSIGTIGVGLRKIVSDVFYAYQDTKTPMLNAGLAMGINIVLNLILSKYMGIGGLALATSISELICCFLLIFNLRKKLGSFGIKGISYTTMKVIAATIFMAALSKFCYVFMLEYTHATISLFIAILIGVLAYFSSIKLLKVSEFNMLFKEINGKIKKMKL